MSHRGAESLRLIQSQIREEHWKRWGPYLSARQWGTVREDYSSDSSCWSYFPFEHADKRAFRWGEDGLLGFTDRKCRICFSVSLWNGRDPILKERLFGLTGPQGNHGEDVKELYFHLHSLPTYSYCSALYKYPQAEFPYARLLSENHERGLQAEEFELLDTGVFEQGNYFDVMVEYAKGSANDILVRYTVTNYSQQSAQLEILPTVWYRNTWSWGREGEAYTRKPYLSLQGEENVLLEHPTMGNFLVCSRKPASFQDTLFTENETNFETLFNQKNASPYVKDAIQRYVLHGERSAVNPAKEGTKVAFHFRETFAAGESKRFEIRMMPQAEVARDPMSESFDEIFEQRRGEVREFYDELLDPTLSPLERNISEQAYAGLLWNKQFYYYSVQEWEEGDPTQPTPALERKGRRNGSWRHLYNMNIISMPDKWEYPWYAAWDLAFHAVAFARIDPEFAKQQLILLLREWYMHPNGQIPAYEFAFSDVNPPVHAWACWRVYKMTAPKERRDRDFLARAFHKLLINFTWWVNRKDVTGNNLFTGGFLGLDNIGVFDRSGPSPLGGVLEQSDATAWMAFYCGTMLSIAMELAEHDSSYSDIASKFFEHFIAITDAMNSLGGSGLWDDRDGFYYDQLCFDQVCHLLRVRSLVGLIPILAVEVLEDETIESLPGFRQRMEWLMLHRTDLARHITSMKHSGPEHHGKRLLAVPAEARLKSLFQYLFDEQEFLSPYGIRSLSKFHEQHPYKFEIPGAESEHEQHEVRYTPGESNSPMFGGNSNWRGPVWFPTNFLLIEALERYHYFYEGKTEFEFPIGSGEMKTLKEVSVDLAKRLVSLFLPDREGLCPSYRRNHLEFYSRPENQALHHFFEYFHGDTGRGLGACHQTGWTALVALCIEKIKRFEEEKS